MRYLIDTQILIWASYGLEPLPPEAARILGHDGNDIYVSIASLWEIAIKSSLGKLGIDLKLFDHLESHRYSILPVQLPHLHYVTRLPHHHRDPFDRLLIAQAMADNLTLITSDKALTAYDAKIILA